MTEQKNSGFKVPGPPGDETGNYEEANAKIVSMVDVILNFPAGTVSDELNVRFGEMIEHMLDRFPAQIGDQDHDPILFAHDFRLDINAQTLNSLPPVSVPVAVVRELLRNRSVRFAHRKSVPWNEFCKRYFKSLTVGFEQASN